MKAALEEANAVVKDAFSAAAKELFEKHPEMETFSWNQYTPYFNDGDSCEFSANTEQESISINGEDAYEIAKDTDWSGSKPKPLPEDELSPLLPAQKDVAEFLQNFDEDDYETMFGDHCEVVVNRDGTIDVEEYSHD